MWHTLTELSVFVCCHALRGPYLSHCIMHSCLVCMHIRLYCHCLTSTINMCVLCKKRQSFYPLRQYRGQFQRGQQGPVCWSCHQQGHVRRNCPQQQQIQPPWTGKLSSRIHTCRSGLVSGHWFSCHYPSRRVWKGAGSPPIETLHSPVVAANGEKLRLTL